MFPSSELSNYQILQENIGEGAFGVVMKGKNIQTGKIVALKKVLIKKTNNIITEFPIKPMREIKTLQHCTHKNILAMFDYFAHGSSLVIVTEYCKTDLYTLMRGKDKPISESDVKNYIYQLLCGLQYIHQNKMIHRDIKPANLFIMDDGTLKIGDFGLATIYLGESKQYSHQVASRWYRAPELLYGSQSYDTAVDMYAVGMVYAEMMNNTPLLKGESDIDQLTMVVKTFGNPNKENWPGVEKMPDFDKINFPKVEPIDIHKLLPNCTEAGIDFFKKLVCYNPKMRMTANKALQHDYFFEEPLMSQNHELNQKFQEKENIFKMEEKNISFFDCIK